MDITKLIGETSDYDKKVAVEKNKPKSWCKSVSAFANTFGGSLVFGVSDNDELIGLENAEGDAEIISEQIKKRISPIPEFRLRFEAVDNKKFVILDIYKGDETPYYYSADGSTEAYIRVGNESVPASPEELKRLVLRGKNSSFDSLISGYDFKDYAFSNLRARFKEWTNRSFEDTQYESFGISDMNGKLTNAGALLADNSPIRYSRVFCTRWNGLTKANGKMDALDSAEYTGSIIELLNNAHAFIKRNTKLMWRKTPNSREEFPEYQERGYFEALVNALIHRDYLVNGSEVHVDIFDDRMEIYSPGGMPDGTMIQDRNIEQIPSTRRNPVLADIFARLGYMEREGSGIKKIRMSSFSSPNFTPDKEPQFYSDRVQFVVTFPNLNYGHKTVQVTDQDTDQVTDQVTDQDIDQVIGNVTLAALVAYCKIPRTRREIQEYCGLSGRSHFREKYLRPLLDKGTLKMTLPDKANSKNQKYYS